jgi:hypothetical protein
MRSAGTQQCWWYSHPGTPVKQTETLLVDIFFVTKKMRKRSVLECREDPWGKRARVEQEWDLEQAAMDLEDAEFEIEHIKEYYGKKIKALQKEFEQCLREAEAALREYQEEYARLAKRK